MKSKEYTLKKPEVVEYNFWFFYISKNTFFHFVPLKF